MHRRSTAPVLSRLLRALPCALVSLLPLSSARADDADLDRPPYDFSDAFYLANGIDPTTLVGRPTGTPPGSILDPTDNGPNFNDIRMLDLTAAFSDSGKPIFFYVTGLPTPASFLPNAAGDDAFAIAEKYKVYEFPRATNPELSVFPKRQDLVADLSNGYFSNNPLGVWQINLVRYTPAAFDTAAGRARLAALAAENGVDLDGTPLLKKKSDVLGLQADGFVRITTPPVGFGRWFFCPVLKDPRGGEVAPDATLTIVEQANGEPLAAERANFDLFHCLQSTGDVCDSSQASSTTVRAGTPPNPIVLHATGAPGEQFRLAVPLTTGLIGVSFSVQGASVRSNGAFRLTNALDAVIGTH